jgi:glycosyltransferase involved in cell wall biosynthesis
MSDQSLVSIIVPVWNAEEYIKESVDSALAQTHPNFEVIVVDDGSTDGTRNILESYAKDSRFKYVYQTNKGLAGARNTGIRESKGEYVAFLDSDDIFMPDKIKEQVDAFETHPDFGVCYSDLTHFSDSPATLSVAMRAGPPAPTRGAWRASSKPREFYHHRYTYPSGDILEPLLRRQFINPLTVMVRREVIDKYGMFNESFRRSEDWELWLRWAHAGVKFYYLNKPLAYYRMRNVGNLSSIESEPTMKEKNLEFFTRFGEKLTSQEKQKYNFDKIIRGLKTKTVFAYLMLGKKEIALKIANDLSLFMRLIIRALPASIWRLSLGKIIQIKHRLLLKKI